MSQKTNNNRHKLLAIGLFILSIGVLWILQKAGVLSWPGYIFSWKTLLIAIGIVGFIQFRLRNFTWLVPILVGSFFLLGDIPGINFNVSDFILPFIILTFGLWLVLAAIWRKRLMNNYEDWCETKGFVSSSTSEDMLDLTAVFGGHKKKVFSKGFKGGEVVNVFGGTELDLSQADFEGTIVIDSSNVFGGMKIVAPSNWNIQLDSTCIMGGVDDKREMKDSSGEASNKKLIITGFCFCGGIEIKNY